MEHRKGTVGRDLRGFALCPEDSSLLEAPCVLNGLPEFTQDIVCPSFVNVNP